MRTSRGSGPRGAGDITVSAGVRRLLRQARWRLPVARGQSPEREKSRNQ
jgi:hypothetical protein